MKSFDAEIDALMALLKSSAPGRAAACLALAEMKQEARQSAELVATLCADQEELRLISFTQPLTSIHYKCDIFKHIIYIKYIM